MGNVECGGGNEQTEVGTLREQTLAEAEEDVGIDASLVGLVEHDNAIMGESWVADELFDEAAVGDVADFCGGVGKVVESDCIAHFFSEFFF